MSSIWFPERLSIIRFLQYSNPERSLISLRDIASLLISKRSVDCIVWSNGIPNASCIASSSPSSEKVTICNKAVSVDSMVGKVVGSGSAISADSTRDEAVGSGVSKDAGASDVIGVSSLP